MISNHELPLAVVTGGARGIGRAVVEDLLGQGYRVIIADLGGSAAEEVAAELGANATSRVLDVTQVGALSGWVRDVESSLGPIAVWVNNAGIMPTGRLIDQDPALIDQMIEVNLRGLMHSTQLLAQLMVARGSGKIINISSATAMKPLAGLAVYSGTKFGVLGFSAALRRELIGTGVQLSVVMPYLAATPLGAGIRAQRGFRVVTADQVSREVMRAIETGRFANYVPRRLGALLKVSQLLPLPVQDAVDDLIDTDRIGLGGDRGERQRYLDGLAGRHDKGAVED